MPIQLTTNDNLVLKILTWYVRLLSLEHLQRILRATCQPCSSASRLVGRLANSGLLQSKTTALTFIEASAPLWIWQPGEFRPDYHGLAWQLERRWQRAHPRRLTICWATDRAARFFGGVAEFTKRASQVEHDLGTASVLVQLYEEHPELASRWVGEMILRRDYAPRQRWLRKIPDAAILDEHRPVTLIEFGGQYSVEHLRRFHRHCARYQLPYTIW